MFFSGIAFSFVLKIVPLSEIKSLHHIVLEVKGLDNLLSRKPLGPVVSHLGVVFLGLRDVAANSFSRDIKNQSTKKGSTINIISSQFPVVIKRDPYKSDCGQRLSKDRDSVIKGLGENASVINHD